MHSVGVNNDWTVKLETNGTDVIYKKDLEPQLMQSLSQYTRHTQLEIRIETDKSKAYYIQGKPNSGNMIM